MKGTVQDNLLSSDLVNNCKMVYLNAIENMQDSLKFGKKQFEQQIEGLTKNMMPYYNDLINVELRLEYLINMKAAEKGTKKNRFSLLIKDQSLIMMQFLSKDKVPSEEQIKKKIQIQLKVTNEQFRKYISEAEKAHDRLLQITSSVESELNWLEQNLISCLENSY